MGPILEAKHNFRPKMRPGQARSNFRVCLTDILKHTDEILSDECIYLHNCYYDCPIELVKAYCHFRRLLNE